MVRLACFLLAACSGSSASTKSSAAAIDAGGSVHAIYRLSTALHFGDIPWPDDNYLDATGHIAVRDLHLPSQADPAYSDALVTALGDLDGFGMRPTIYFRFEDLLLQDSTPQTPDESLSLHASVFMLDADTSSPEAFQRIPIDVVTLSAAGSDAGAAYGELRVRPAGYRALTPGRRYAVVVTDGVKTSRGPSVVADDGFLRVRDPDLPLSGTNERAARALYAPVLATLEQQNIAKREHVVALAVFHVQSAGTELAEARALVRANDPPMPVFTDALSGKRLDDVLGTPPPSERGLDRGGPHGHISWMIHGSFQAPNFLSQKSGAHGAFERDESGALREKGDVDVYFSVFLPRNEAPNEAYPVAIVQHGLGGDRSDALPLANALASSGYAVVALDAPFHGLSAGQGDSRNRFTGANSPDGFGDLPGDFFGQSDDGGDLIAFHPYYYRDALRQGVVNLATLVYLLQAGNWSGLANLNAMLPQVRFDATRLALIGIDFGGEMGALLAPIEPSLGALIPAFSSGLTLDDWAESPGRKDLVDSLIMRLGRDPNSIDWRSDSPLLWPDVDAWRALTDRASPLIAASALRRASTNMLLLMARDDEFVNYFGSEAFAEPVGADILGAMPGYVLDLQHIDLDAGATLRANFPKGAGTVTRVVYQIGDASHTALTFSDDTLRYKTPFSRPFMLRETPMPITNPLAQTMTQIAFLLESLRSCPPPSAGVLPVCAASVQAPPEAIGTPATSQ